MSTLLKHLLSRLPWRNDRGGVMIEFAFAMPMLITLLLGGVELGRYVLLQQKLDRTAMTVSDLVTRVSSVTAADLDTVLSAASLIMTPFDLGARGKVVISAVRDDAGGTPTVIWQRSGAGTLSVTSQVGTTGTTAVLSDPTLVDTTQGVVVGETYFEYSPWFITLIPSTLIRHVAIFRPRLSNEVVCSDC